MERKDGNYDSVGRALYNERRSVIANDLGKILDGIVEMNTDFCYNFGKDGRLQEMIETTYQDICQHVSDAAVPSDNTILIRRFNKLDGPRSRLMQKAKPFGLKLHAGFNITRGAINGLPAVGDKMSNYEVAKALAKLETDDLIYKCYREVNIGKLRAELANLHKEINEFAELLEMIWMNTDMDATEE